MTDWLKAFFQKAPAVVAAVVLIMAADLLFLYKILALGLSFAGDPFLYGLVVMSQMLVFCVILKMCNTLRDTKK